MIELDNWSERELLPGAGLDRQLDCPAVMESFFRRRKIESASQLEQFLDNSAEPAGSSQEIQNLDSLAVFLLALLRDKQPIKLSFSPRFSAFLSAALLQNGLRSLGGEVEIVAAEPSGMSTHVGLFTGDQMGNLGDSEFYLSARPVQQFSGTSQQVVGLEKAEICLTLLCYRVVETVARKLYEAELPSFVAVDLETTGYSARNSEIIEIGAVKYYKGQLVDSFETTVHSVDRVPPKIVEITGLTDADVQAGLPPDEALEKFLRFLGESLVVAHNKGFDLSFLRHHCKKYLGRGLPNSSADSMRVAQASLPGLPSYSLKGVCQHMGVELVDHHRALADARASGEIYARLKSETPGDIDKVLAEISPYFVLERAWKWSSDSRLERQVYRRGINWLRENISGELVVQGTPPAAHFFINGLPDRLHRQLRNEVEYNSPELLVKRLSEEPVWLEKLAVTDRPAQQFVSRLLERHEKEMTAANFVYDGEITAKELYKLGEGFLKLLPFSANFPPLIVKLSKMQLINLRSVGEVHKLLTLKDTTGWCQALILADQVDQVGVLQPGRSVTLVGKVTVSLWSEKFPIIQIYSLAKG